METTCTHVGTRELIHVPAAVTEVSPKSSHLSPQRWWPQLPHTLDLQNVWGPPTCRGRALTSLRPLPIHPRSRARESSPSGFGAGEAPQRRQSRLRPLSGRPHTGAHAWAGLPDVPCAQGNTICLPGKALGASKPSAGQRGPGPPS